MRQDPVAMPQLDAPPRPGGHYAPHLPRLDALYEQVGPELGQHFSRPTDIHARFPSLPVPKNALGNPLNYGRYILWRGERNTELIISSHGIRLLGRMMDVPEGTQIYFYGPDFAVLSTSNIYKDFVCRSAKPTPVEILSGGQVCADYALSKFQCDMETYDHVRACLPYYDVVTIQAMARPGWREDVLLSELLAHLEFHKHRYSKIHSVHCRVMDESTRQDFPEMEKFHRPPFRMIRPPR